MDKHFADILADKEKNSDKHDGHYHHGEAKANTPPHGGAEKSASAATSSPGREHRHAHDRLGAQSVGVEVAEGPIDWAKFTSWLKVTQPARGVGGVCAWIRSTHLNKPEDPLPTTERLTEPVFSRDCPLFSVDPGLPRERRRGVDLEAEGGVVDDRR